MRPSALSIALFLACLPLAAASGQEGGLEQLLIRAKTSTGTDLSHIDGGVYMQGNQPICAFGVIQLPDQKPQYSYFILFKRLSKPADDFRVTGPLRSKSNQFDYKVVLEVADKKFEIAHRFAIDDDTNKVLTDELQVGDKSIKPGEPRFFVVDVACDPPSVTAIQQKLPELVLDPAARDGDLDAIRKIAASLTESKDIAELLR